MPTVLLLAYLALCAAEAWAQRPAGYTQPSACATCHAAISKTYSKTPMAQSFGAVGLATSFPELQHGGFQHDASNQFFSLANREGSTFLRRQQPGFNGSASNVVEKKIDYWFGSGNHARSYLSRSVSNDLIELPITWYSEKGGYWAMSPAYDVPQHAGFSRKITYRCMFCHNAYPDLPAGADRWENATRWPEQLPSGIDCQRCHGPGQNHVDVARLGRSPAIVRDAIVNPTRLDARRQMEICLQCHLETTNLPLPGVLLRRGRQVFSYRPGEPLEQYALFFDHAPGTGHENKFEFAGAPYQLLKSRCFLESRGKLTCSTCHNPHRQGTAGGYNRICQNCHSTLTETHSEQQDCVSCHMPKRRPSDAVHVAITNHQIKRRTNPEASGPLVENNGSNTPPYRGKVVLYYPEFLEDDQTRDLYLAVAQVANQANLREGIASLERAIAKWKPAESPFYVDLAAAYQNAGNPKQAVELYRQAIARDPANWAAYFGLGSTLGQFGEDALRRALSLAPWNNEIPKSLASLLIDAGKLPDAVAILRAAVQSDPDSGELQNNLGLALLRTGDSAAAQLFLREAVRLRPEISSIRINLATLLARNREWPQARHEFEQAIRFDSSPAEAQSAYATALVAQNDLSAARAHFETALTLKPALWNTHNNLGTLLERMGDPAGAIREYQAALAIHPDFAMAHYNLGIALTAANRSAEAKQHLETALRLAEKSEDPKLSKSAAEALRKANHPGKK